MKKRFLYTTFLPLLLIKTSSAQATGSSIGIYPQVIRINSDPLTQITIPITLVNNSEEDKLFEIDALGFKKSNSSYGSIEYYTQKNIPDDLSSLIRSLKAYDSENEIKSIKLYPEEQKELAIKFMSPNEQKDYYVTLVFSEKSKKEAKGTDSLVNISQSIGSHILLSVGHPEKQKSYIAKMSVNKLAVSGPIKIELEVKNASSHFITINGNVSIYNIIGKKVAEKEIPPTTVLAESTKNLTNTTHDLNSFVVDGSFSGIYTAQATIQVDHRYEETKQDSFLYLPLITLIFIFLAIFILLGISYKVIKKLNFKSN